MTDVLRSQRPRLEQFFTPLRLKPQSDDRERICDRDGEPERHGIRPSILSRGGMRRVQKLLPALQAEMLIDASTLAPLALISVGTGN